MNPTRADLLEAARLARLTIPVDVALSIPALAYCLKQTALCVAKRRNTNPHPKTDFKKLSAGDLD